MHIPGLLRLRMLDRKILRLFYGFDKWHVSKRFQRPYVSEIINYINNLPEEHRNKVCEIGVGLGDILRNIDCKEKTFLESDIKALEACRFLSKIRNKGNGKKSFSIFTFPGSQLTDKYDVIIMVNWIHAIDPETLNSNLINYFNNNLLSGGCIILDSVEAEFANYHHDFKKFTEQTKVIRKELRDIFVFGRRIRIFEKP